MQQPIQYATKYFVDAEGSYLGGYAGPEDHPGIEVATAPAHALDVWDFKNAAWIPVPPPANILGFFDGLVKAILSGQLPPDVHTKAKMVEDLINPADQSAALIALAADPIYTAKQKTVFDALIVANNLALPQI
jgi:hypothetical protein